MTEEIIERLEVFAKRWLMFKYDKTVKLSYEDKELTNDIHKELGLGPLDFGCGKCVLNGWVSIMKKYDVAVSRMQVKNAPKVIKTVKAKSKPVTKRTTPKKPKKKAQPAKRKRNASKKG